LKKSGLTALVFGAGGLTGKILTEKLLNDPSFSHVRIFSRRKSGFTHPKAEEVVVNFNDENSLAHQLQGDVLFCCLGTTIRTAGSKEAFEKVDYHYPAMLSGLAAKNGVQKFLMISSLGADKDSSNFYYRTKGRAEEAVTKSSIPSVYFFRPSMLLGKREEFRLGEMTGKVVMRIFSFLFIGKLKKYRAVPAAKVADAMIWFSLHGEDKVRVVENDEILVFRS
jgi:uncharacterized protein YbjT (DUF2867 family)